MLSGRPTFLGRVKGVELPQEEDHKRKKLVTYVDCALKCLDFKSSLLFPHSDHDWSNHEVYQLAGTSCTLS